MALCWLSFADPKRPEGQQFLGACIVPMGETGDTRTDLHLAMKNAWRLRCNPGGEIRFQPIMPSIERHIHAKWIGRLLSREECAEFDREIMPHGVS
jgi:hypothetical protein